MKKDEKKVVYGAFFFVLKRLYKERCVYLYEQS